MVSVKVRRPQYDRNHLYGFTIPEFATYRGDILETPKWVEYDAVCLSTGDSRWPFRIIPRNEIVSIDDQTVDYVAPAARNKTWQIAGSKGNVYTVTQEGNRYTCDCPGFQFRKNCRHVIECKEVK